MSALDDEVRRLSLDLDFKDAECNALADEVEQRNLMLNEASNLILQMVTEFARKLSFFLSYSFVYSFSIYLIVIIIFFYSKPSIQMRLLDC